ncbi:MAG: hypothetical protein MUF45_06395 [Spirosomaceae bacterium]|nr:hypothetical protein [Spirosomataceae bacterium]
MSDATTITVNQKPAAPVVSANPNTVTIGQTSTLTASGCTGGIVTWAFNNSTTNPITFTPTSSASYTATCTVNDCISVPSNPVTVTVVTGEPCTNLLTLSSTTNDYNSGTQLKQASATNGKIMATNKVTGTAKVTYQAKSIELNAGFRAEGGTVFKAEIGGCSN